MNNPEPLVLEGSGSGQFLEENAQKGHPKNGSGSIIQLRDVVKVYTTGAGEFTALNGINLEIQNGEFLGFIGRSGAGKTTLLNMISGVSEITSGEVLFYERNHGSQAAQQKAVSVHAMDENQMAVWRGNNVGIVYQSFELMPQLNLVNNIMLPQDFLGYYQPRISTERALELLEMVELTEHAYKLPAHISGGQKQRVAIARALANDPPVILADEPTGNLDTVTAERIFHIFEKLVDQGKTLILVTHDSNMASRFSRVVGISDGEIVSDLEGDGRAHENPQRLEDHPGMKAVSKETRPSHVSVPGNGRGAAKELSMPKANTEPQVSTDKGNASELDAAFAAAAATESLPKKKGKSWALPRIMPGSNGTKNRQAISPQNGPAILLQDVVKTYVNAAGQFTALKGVNLAMDYGQFISIVGKSGSGKSTLLNMLTGIDHPTSGEVIVGGQNIYQMSESRRALWRGRNVGIVFQFFQLIPTLTLLENTMLPMDYCDIYRSRERPERALELLRMVGLADQADKLPSSVSSGQQQSAAIARALATDPPIIVADEPTGNLDSRSAENILQLFSRLAKGGKTILIVTHDPSFTSRTDQTVILSDGEIIDDAVARALPLLNHPQMLQATHQAEKRAYAPGSVIIRQGERVEYFFMISKGEVDILLKRPDCQEITLARMGQGQFFGEIELIHSENSVASVRAAGEEPAELTLLPRDEFYRLLRDAPLTQNFVEKVADARLEENQAHNNGCEEE